MTKPGAKALLRLLSTQRNEPFPRGQCAHRAWLDVSDLAAAAVVSRLPRLGVPRLIAAIRRQAPPDELIHDRNVRATLELVDAYIRTGDNATAEDAMRAGARCNAGTPHGMAALYLGHVTLCAGDLCLQAAAAAMRAWREAVGLAPGPELAGIARAEFPFDEVLEAAEGRRC